MGFSHPPQEVSEDSAGNSVGEKGDKVA
jgi:hypothetical protein